MKFEYAAIPEGATEAQIQEITKARKATLKAASVELVDTVGKILSGEAQVPDLKEAYEFLTAKRPRAKKSVKAKKVKLSREDIVLSFFGNPDNLDRKGQADEVKVFVSTKLGRADVLTGLKKALDIVAPADRVWVSFDSEKGLYSLLGRGESAPDGWTGKLPAPKAVLIDDESAIGPG